MTIIGPIAGQSIPDAGRVANAGAAAPQGTFARVVHALDRELPDEASDSAEPDAALGTSRQDDEDTNPLADSATAQGTSDQSGDADVAHRPSATEGGDTALNPANLPIGIAVGPQTPIDAMFDEHAMGYGSGRTKSGTEVARLASPSATSQSGSSAMNLQVLASEFAGDAEETAQDRGPSPIHRDGRTPGGSSISGSGTFPPRLATGSVEIGFPGPAAGMTDGIGRSRRTADHMATTTETTPWARHGSEGKQGPETLDRSHPIPGVAHRQDNPGAIRALQSIASTDTAPLERRGLLHVAPEFSRATDRAEGGDRLAPGALDRSAQPVGNGQVGTPFHTGAGRPFTPVRDPHGPVRVVNPM